MQLLKLAIISITLIACTKSPLAAMNAHNLEEQSEHKTTLFTIDNNQLIVEILKLKNQVELLKQAKQENPAIDSVKIIKDKRKNGYKVLSGEDLSRIHEAFPNITHLYLDGLSLTSSVLNFLRYYFPNLTALYLDNNPGLKTVEPLKIAPFSQKLTLISIINTGISALDHDQIKKIFPNASIRFIDTEAPKKTEIVAAEKASSKRKSLKSVVQETSSTNLEKSLSAQTQTPLEKVLYPIVFSLPTIKKDPEKLQQEANNYKDKLVTSIKIEPGAGEDRDLRLSGKDLKKIAAHFPLVTTLDLTSTRIAIELKAIGDCFPNLTVLYLTNNKQLKTLNFLLTSPIATQLTYLDIQDTGIALSDDELKNYFPNAEIKTNKNEENNATVIEDQPWSNNDGLKVVDERLTVPLALLKHNSKKIKELAEKKNITKVTVTKSGDLNLAIQDINNLGRYIYNLKELNVANTNMKGKLTDLNSYLPKLRLLYLNNNGRIKDVQFTAPRLRHLDIRNTSIDLSVSELEKRFPKAQIIKNDEKSCWQNKKRSSTQDTTTEACQAKRTKQTSTTAHSLSQSTTSSTHIVTPVVTSEEVKQKLERFLIDYNKWQALVLDNPSNATESLFKILVEKETAALREILIGYRNAGHLVDQVVSHTKGVAHTAIEYKNGVALELLIEIEPSILLSRRHPEQHTPLQMLLTQEEPQLKLLETILETLLKTATKYPFLLTEVLTESSVKQLLESCNKKLIKLVLRLIRLTGHANTTLQIPTSKAVCKLLHVALEELQEEEPLDFAQDPVAQASPIPVLDLTAASLEISLI